MPHMRISAALVCLTPALVFLLARLGGLRAGHGHAVEVYDATTVVLGVIEARP